MKRDAYWACSVCDSGGSPLTLKEAQEGSWGHIEATRHFSIYSAIPERST